MKISFILLLLTLLIYLTKNQCSPFGRRIQYDASLTNTQPTYKFIIGFNTLQLCTSSYVVILYKSKLQTFNCATTKFTASQKMGYFNAFIHKCLITNVDYNEVIYYKIVNTDGAGKNIRRQQDKKMVNEWVPLQVSDPRWQDDKNILVFADWGVIQDKKMQTINDHILKVMQSTKIDLLMINGDIAYDLDSDKGKRYTDFLYMMDNVTSRIPVVFILGNHQHFTNDTIQLFNSTFQLYKIYDTLATGFTYGKFYMILFDPYNKVYKKYQEISSLQALLVQLKKGKEIGKFIVPFSHYPLTCSSQWQQCQQRLNRMFNYFDSMLEYNVSLYIGAHTHSYQRNYPYYGNQTFQTQQSPYDHGKPYLVSIIQGVAGNNISIMTQMQKQQSYTAQYTVNETGFGILSNNKYQVMYNHYSTRRGFMDEMIINLNDGVMKVVQK